jgi:PIN domain nuclease of toxin-antitoxin system
MGQQAISYLDTNVVIFLHSGNVTRLTQRAMDQIESSDLLVSGMVMLELEMLCEKSALKYSASQILAALNQQIGVSVCQLPMSAIMTSALAIKWTRDPGDRIIVANAVANNEAPLITSDRRIHEHYQNAIW